MTNTNSGSHANGPVLKFTVAGVQHESHEQYIEGIKIRKLAGAHPEDKILLAIRKPWADELITDETVIDLAREGIEHFLVVKAHEEFLVSISINDREYKIKRGVHSVAELKKIAGVLLADELEEIIDGVLKPLKDDGTVLIKGCEIFISHKRDGTSS